MVFFTIAKQLMVFGMTAYPQFGNPSDSKKPSRLPNVDVLLTRPIGIGKLRELMTPRKTPSSDTAKEISCRITRTLLMYVRENNSGSLGNLLDDSPLDEAYLSDANNWVSHAFLQKVYKRMLDLLGDDNAVYKMTLASERYRSLGLLDSIVRLLGSPKLIYSQAPKYNKLLKRNGSVIIHDIGDTWVLLEDRYHDSGQKTRFDCDYTRGVIAGIPTLFGLPEADVEEIECQVAPEIYGTRAWPDNPRQGCTGCLYRVSWRPSFKPSLWKRTFKRRQYYRKAIEELQESNRLIQKKYDETSRLATDLDQANQQLVAQQQQMEAQAKALIASERQYRVLADNVTDVIWILDLATLKFDYISPSVERSRGFTQEEAKALSLEETVSKISLDKVTEILTEELAQDNRAGVDPQRSKTIKIQETRKDGTYSWAEVTVSFVRNDSGQPTAVMGVTRDIAERMRAEAAMAESEAKYRNLFVNGSDLLCIHDLGGNLLETNLHYKKQYGWREDDLKGVNIRDIMPDRFKDEFDHYMERVMRNGADEGHLSIVKKDEDEILLEYRNVLIYDNSGHAIAVQGAARDVTESVRAQEALKESEEKYRELVQYAPAGIYEFDLVNIKFISVNDVMCDYTGYTREEFLALDPYNLIAEESLGTAAKVLDAVFSGQSNPEPVEYKIRAKNGRELWVLVNSKAFFENGVPVRSMSVVHDLTVIRKAQEEKQNLEIRLQNAQKLESLGTLAGGVAHDLNNILSGIVSYPELLLLDLAPDSPLRAPLQAIKESGEKAAEIVQDLLTLTRRGVAARKVTNLKGIVAEFLKSPEYRHMVSQSSRITVDTRLGPDTLNMAGSILHLSKTLMNLIANAVDAMPSGGEITIATGNRYVDKVYQGYESIPEGEYTVLEVSDQGIGMPFSDLSRIFEPFYTKKSMGRSGTGLGMSVVWGTVKDHDGFIDIQSEEGYGTTFTLYFPATRSENEITASVYIEDYLGNDESILIVDDSPNQRDLAARMMQRLGYKVYTAESGEDAIARMAKQTFDLVILDMIMDPGMDGLETFKQMRQITPTQKAVIASGYSESERVREMQRIGAGSYVKKPYTLEKIGLAVRKELDRNNNARSTDGVS
jgi:two-component system, cell cycle sensor histidine kinase and response regulator CckA